MPIEIRELVIRAEIETSQGSGGQSEETSGSTSDRAQLVRDCVEQVMELLRQKEER